MRKVSTDVKAGIWYTVGNFVNRGIAFISTPVFARMLSKEDYGEFSNFSAWATLLVVITSLDMYASINPAYQEYEEDFDAYMSTISWISITFSAICYFFVWIFRDWVVDLLGMNFLYVNMLFLYLLFAPATQLFLSCQRIRGRYKSAIFVSAGSALISLVLSVVAVLVFQNKLLGRVVGYVLPVVMINAVLYGVFMAKGRAFVRAKAKYALVLAVPLIPHHLSGSILAKSDQFMIKRYCGNVELAVYSFAYNCSLAVSILSTSVNQAYVPWLYRKMKEDNLQEIDGQARKLFGLFLMLVLGVMLLGPEMVLILGGRKYVDSIYLIPIIMTGYCFKFLYTYYVNIELYCKKSITISLVTLLAAIINIVLNFLWIPKYGYKAAAFTTTISFIALYILHSIVIRKTEYCNLYRHRKLFLAGMLFGVCALGTEYLYQVTVLRYCVFFIYLMGICYIAYKYFGAGRE